ncbi:MAG: ABC transporter substrate-binding protein [Coriobacteriia bacterium]|nr:ABC transporter substrate-binding protein [Coriobacteriia bacterium]
MELRNRPLTRRQFVEFAGLTGVAALSSGALWGCAAKSGDSGSAAFNIDNADWSAIVAEAKGKSVSFYGWGGDENRNKWLDTTVTDALKKDYDITLKRVPMGINDVLTQLSGEMQAGAKEGSIDFIWINGENFYSTMQNGYLYGPFCQRLPNFRDYVDANTEITYDFGKPNNGYEAPYGKAQMVLLVDIKKTPTPPSTAADFFTFCKANKGRVTYPAAGDFTGTAFISCLLASAMGADQWKKLTAMNANDEKAIRDLVEPGLKYLRSLNPYLWKNGTTFPADSGTVYTMFQDGELVLHMTYDPFGWINDVKSGLIPDTTQSFILREGTVGNTNFMAIAKNAPHKAAALVAINEILSPKIQLSQYETLKTVTVLDVSKVDSNTQAAFKSVSLGKGTLSLSELLAHRLPEVSGGVITLIEKLWTSEVVGK